MAGPGTVASQPNPLARVLEAALWLSAVACFGTLLAVAFRSAHAQLAVQRLALQSLAVQNRAKPAAQGANSTTEQSAAEQKATPGQVIGQLQIPALHLSVPVTAGIESDSLLAGVGHVDGSALPGGLGTVVLAGHRDTYLRPLEHIAKGMTILLTSSAGTYRYAVDNWEIVLPEQVDSIAIHSRPELALVTCYPFHYIGAAPKRFIVHAHLHSLLPEPAPF